MDNRLNVIPFMKATEARRRTRNLLESTTRDALLTTGKIVHDAVGRAIANKQVMTTVQVPFGFSDDVVSMMKQTFRRKGYSVRVTSTGGLFQRGLVWHCRTYITLAW